MASEVAASSAGRSQASIDQALRAVSDERERERSLPDGLEAIGCHHRLENIQLKMTVRPTDRHRCLIPHHLSEDDSADGQELCQGLVGKRLFYESSPERRS